jgi:hypothetical protein
MMKNKFILSAQVSSINDLMKNNMDIPNLEDVATRCVERWHVDKNVFSKSDVAATSKDGNCNCCNIGETFNI